MIINLTKTNLKNIQNLKELNRRDWKYQSNHCIASHVCIEKAFKVEFNKMLYPLPFLFLSGIFLGIAIMLSL